MIPVTFRFRPKAHLSPVDAYDPKTHWEAVYHDRDPVEVSWYQDEPAMSLRMIRAAGIRPGDPLIDVGGGASLLVDRLLDEGFSRLAVLDVSRTALQAARRRLGERAHRVTWYEADATAFDPPVTFALWHDRAVFHFLTEPADRRRYRDALDRALKPGGAVVVGTFAPDGPTRCSGLPVVRYAADGLARELGAGYRLVEEDAEVHHTPSGKDQRFGWYRFERTA